MDMTDTYLGSAVSFDEYGNIQSVKHQRIAEIIKDLDPTLELAWIPPNRRSSFDAHPFAVVHRPGTLPPYVVFTCTEEEVDHRLIQRLIAGRDVSIGKLDSEFAARQLVDLKNRIADQEEREEFAHSVLNSRKHTYRHNGKVYS